MNNFQNNPILVKIQEVSQKLSSNLFISSLTSGLMTTMSVIMIGALSQVLGALGTMTGLFTADSAVYNYITLPYEYTMKLLGLWVVVGIAYHYAKALRMKSPLGNAIDAAIVYMLVCAPFIEGKIDTTFLSSTGMFVGFIIAFSVVRIEKFCIDKKLRIPMPDVCPPSLVNSFAAIIPLGVSVIIFQGINILLSSISGGALSLPTALMAILMIPLGPLTSLPGIFVLTFITFLLWGFGIHGGAITFPIIMAAMFATVQTNASLHAAGQPLLFNPVLLYGSLDLFPLVILGLMAKSKQLKAVSKVSIIPSFFGIHEPAVFGMPLMYNPILVIPLILSTLVLMAMQYFAIKMNLIGLPWIMMFGIFPKGFGAYLGTMDFRNVIFSYLTLIPQLLIWYPFFKVYDNQLVKKENSVEEITQTEALS